MYGEDLSLVEAFVFVGNLSLEEVLEFVGDLSIEVSLVFLVSAPLLR